MHFHHTCTEAEAPKVYFGRLVVKGRDFKAESTDTKRRKMIRSLKAMSAKKLFYNQQEIHVTCRSQKGMRLCCERATVLR